mmetsp:Transcript_27880/g.76741  ORF Transcript_27880/g.76741 Transcript_27880/m.76741 type:complete len:299 (-) Transcript_27880:170-1066(-)
MENTQACQICKLGRNSPRQFPMDSTGIVNAQNDQVLQINHFSGQSPTNPRVLKLQSSDAILSIATHALPFAFCLGYAQPICLGCTGPGFVNVGREIKDCGGVALNQLPVLQAQSSPSMFFQISSIKPKLILILKPNIGMTLRRSICLNRCTAIWRGSNNRIVHDQILDKGGMSASVSISRLRSSSWRECGPCISWEVRKRRTCGDWSWCWRWHGRRTSDICAIGVGVVINDATTAAATIVTSRQQRCQQNHNQKNQTTDAASQAIHPTFQSASFRVVAGPLVSSKSAGQIGCKPQAAR